MSSPAGDDLAEAGLRVDTDNGVLTITLDRPEVRNAQTPAMWRALAAVGGSVGPDVRVVVVRGAGVSFSAGLDRAMLTPEGLAGERGFPELAALSDDALDDAIAGFQRAFTWLRDPGIVSVAAVQGHAVGAGFQLALACDLRVVASDAAFCMREPALGLVPDLGGTKPLVDLVGYARALEVCATSRWVGAAESASLGLATVVVEPGELEATTRDLVDALTGADHDTVTALKPLLQGAVSRSYEEQCAAERTVQAGCIRALVRGLRGS